MPNAPVRPGDGRMYRVRAYEMSHGREQHHSDSASPMSRERAEWLRAALVIECQHISRAEIITETEAQARMKYATVESARECLTTLVRELERVDPENALLAQLPFSQFRLTRAVAEGGE